MEIVGGLASPLPDERRKAREQLDHMGSGRALSLLVAALGDENWRIRKSAADVLAEWEDPKEVVGQLIELLGPESDANRRNAAVEVLIRLGTSAVEQLLVALKDPDPHVRKLVVDVLGAICDRRAEGPIISTLSDSDENVRTAAVEALANFTDERATGALLELVDGADTTMRFYAMESLAKMKVRLPIDKIKPLLDQKILRRAALDALGNCPTFESVKLLVGAMRDESRANRKAAARALGKLFVDNSALRTKIKKSLNSEEDKAALLNAFAEVLDNSNLEIKRHSIKLVGALLHPESVKLLVEAAREPGLEAEAMESIANLAAEDKDVVVGNLPPWDAPLRELLLKIIEEGTPRVAPPKPAADRMTKLTMTDYEFTRFRNFLHRICGIYFNDDMKFILEKRLLRRLEILGMSDFGSYLKYTMEKPEGKKEIGEAINILTTNETYFFREKFQLKAFSEEILPEIWKENEKSDNRGLRIWSAGCSSGEEVYTLAMLVKESGMFEDGDVTIMGSDISNRVIKKAREGVYSASSFRETPKEYLKQYFKPHEKGQYKINRDVRDMVEFNEMNLVNKEEVFSVGAFDIIFCRNVIIYFDLDVKRKVIEYLFNVLKPGGYLLLGHSESLLNISNKFDLVHLKNDMVYRKPLEKKVAQA